MKDKVLQLIETKISNAEDNLRLARLSLTRIGEGPGETGKTFEDMIAGYEQSMQEAYDMKAWLLGVVG